MALSDGLLAEARRARDRAIDLQRETDLAQVGYQHAIRRLHASGGSLREIADALGLSYQRVHQVVDAGSGKGALKQARIGGACAFCGTGRAQTATLIAGPGLLICDRCIDLAATVLAAGEVRSGMRCAVEPGARCGFCGRRSDRAGAMAEAPARPAVGKFARRGAGVRICGECVALCDEIVAEELA